MCDMDMDSGGDFDVGSDSDLGSGFDLDISSDVESLDSLDDVDGSSSESDDSSMSLGSLDLDLADESFDEFDSQTVIEVSEASEYLLSDLDKMPDIDGFESVSDFDIDASEGEIEMLEMDESIDETTETNRETGILLEDLDAVKDILDEHIVPLDTNDELDSLGLPEVRSGESDSFEGLVDIQSEIQEPELEVQTEEIIEIGPDMLYPEQELAEVSLDYLSDMPDDIQEELGVSENTADEIEVLSEDTNAERDSENEFESLSLEELVNPASEPVNNEVDEPPATREEEMLNNPEEILETLQAERDRHTEIREDLAEMQISETDETDGDADDEPPMIRTREITSEMLESRERDTEEVIDSYRDNLREHGVDDTTIEEFVTHEREKINAEYASLDRGDEHPQMYEAPSDWEGVAASLTGQESQGGLSDELSPISDTQDQPSEGLVTESQELEINYDEIYEGIQQESLEQGFENIQIDADPERLDRSLENFGESTWEGLTLNEQKDTMESLANYVVDVIGFERPPMIEYYNNPQEGDFGGYDASSNTLEINEYMLYNSTEAADTIAHELWHAHQHECATSPQSTRDYQYQYNFENYIPPSLGQKAYESQLVEAEARAFAAQFKDRLSHINGRSR